ncbi:MAG: hypothetical protein K9L26_00240 [Candidatus Izimaplasma sp.]|nr:hypothetical protein [Candidatus Izimaplasma bacterium]
MLPLDNTLIYRDYASWKLENHDMLEAFKKNDNLIYERLEPVYAVIDHIYDSVCSKEGLDEDLEHIFEIGFNYLDRRFNVIRIYFETLFKSDCKDFNEYTEMVYYLIYLTDLREDLEHHGYDPDMDELDFLETTIENMIMERRKDFLYIKDLLNKTLQKVFKKINYDYVNIIDIYVEIAENLKIYLYEEDEITLGNELE